MTEPERTAVVEWRCPECDWFIAYSTEVGKEEGPAAWLTRRSERHELSHKTP